MLFKTFVCFALMDVVILVLFLCRLQRPCAFLFKIYTYLFMMSGYGEENFDIGC